MPNKFLPPTTTTVTRTAATPIDGEVLYDIDEKKLYYGDGTTLGGNQIPTVSDLSVYALAYTITATKTANYTAAENEIVVCNTSGGTFNVTTPTSGTFGIHDLIGTSPTTGFGVTGKEVVVLPNTGLTVMGATSLTLDIGAISPMFTLFGTDYRITNRG